MSVSLETAKSAGLGISKKFAAAAIALLLGGRLLLAQEVGGEANLKLPDLSQVSFWDVLTVISCCCMELGSACWIAVRVDDFHAAEEHAGASLDARDFGTDLRNVQDLSDHAGQIPAVAGDFHRRGDHPLFRRVAEV